MIAATVATDKRLNSLSEEAELVFLKTIPHLDRDGIIIGDPALLAFKVCPRRPRLIAMMEDIIQEWIGAGLVIAYEPGEDQLLFFPGFTKNQVGMRYERETDSLFPPPPGYYRNGAGLEPIQDKPDTPRQDDGNNPPDSGKHPANIRQTSGDMSAEGKGKEKKGKEGKETSESDLTEQPARAREAEPTPSTPTVEISFDPPVIEPPPRQPSKQKPPNHGTAPPGQYVKRGTGESPYWVFREYTKRSMTNLQIDAINATVTDIAQWRKVCERWAELYGEEWYKFGHLDWYRNGIPSQNGANNGRYSSNRSNQRQTNSGNAPTGRATNGNRPGAGPPSGGGVQGDGFKLDEFKLTAELVNKRITEAEYEQRLHALKVSYGMPVVSGARALPPS
jgi:hypothetical protein